MIDNPFDTKEKIQVAIAAFKSLSNHPGWKLVEWIQDQNIEVAREQLEIGIGQGETLANVDNARLRLKMFKDFKNTPLMMIEKLIAPSTETPVLDPFDTIEDVRKRKKMAGTRES